MIQPQTIPFTLPELIDFELQMLLDRRIDAKTLDQRDQGVLAETEMLKAGKVVVFRRWLSRLPQGIGKRFAAARGLTLFLSALIGALSGYGSIQGLLSYDGSQPVNIIPFLALYCFLPLLFLAVLCLRVLILRLLRRMPLSWTSPLARWLLLRSLRPLGDDSLAWDLWQRLKALHPRILSLQAWIIPQTFALAFYGSSLISFFLLLTVNDYTFAWRSTLDIGAEELQELLQVIALPFSFLVPSALPSLELIEATQFNRFERSYPIAQASQLSAAWWPFLALVMLVYACLPRLLLALYLPWQLQRALANLAFDDLASESLWLRLQQAALRWQNSQGTRPKALNVKESLLSRGKNREALLLRWRNADFPDEEVRVFLRARGLIVKSFLDADGRDSEQTLILEALTSHEALVVLADPWELPGEALDRLRKRIRGEGHARLPVLFAALSRDAGGQLALPQGQDEFLWQQSLNAFSDPFVALISEPGRSP